MRRCKPPHVFADILVTIPGLHKRGAMCRATGICRGCDRPIVVILAEVKDNPGASMMNLCEVFAYYALVGFGMPCECILWIEHYPNHGPKDETFDIVEFGPRRDNQRIDSLGPARWHPSSRRQLEHMIGCELGPMLSRR